MMVCMHCICVHVCIKLLVVCMTQTVDNLSVSTSGMTSLIVLVICERQCITLRSLVHAVHTGCNLEC